MASDVLMAFAAGSLLVFGAGRLKQRLNTWVTDVKARTASAVAKEQALQRNEAAEGLLKARGYAIVARDAPASYAVSVDGEPMVVNVSADFLVEQNGKRFVAEVKVGAGARLETPATRWQFLEHQHAFGVDSVMLVDPDASALSTIRFPLPRTSLTAVPPPLPKARAQSLLAQRTAKAEARGEQSRRMVRYLVVASMLGFIAWLLASRDAQPGPAGPAPATIVDATVEGAPEEIEVEALGDHVSADDEGARDVAE